jgi:hypothetical protein
MQGFQRSCLIDTQRRLFLFLVDATDGITPELGEAGGQPQISKNGAAFANTAGVLVAIGNGAYYVELTRGEIDTIGWILVRYKSANTAEFQGIAHISAFFI